MKMIYEIVNPSDPYTMETDNLLAACIACTMLGAGKYALRQQDGEVEMPLFIFGGIEQWFEKKFEKPIAELLDGSNDIPVIEALDSVLIGDATDRKIYKAAIEKMDAEAVKVFRKEWQDKKRSSMNDIGARAEHISASMREAINYVETANGPKDRST
jgi:hypothetical protein